jgi:hypothetical protein
MVCIGSVLWPFWGRGRPKRGGAWWGGLKMGGAFWGSVSESFWVEKIHSVVLGGTRWFLAYASFHIDNRYCNNSNLS